MSRLEQKVTIVSTGFSDLLERVAMIESRVDTITKNQADLNQNKESVVLSLQFIKEEINNLKNQITGINDKLYNLTPAHTSEGGGADGDENQNSTIHQPESIYFTAYSDYLKKNYDLAIQGFKQFIKLFPQNRLAENSLYWIGECYYSQKMFQEAVNTFSELINKYENGVKIAAATLKKGFAMIEMGNQSEGINVLKELISRFPLSEEASLAQQKIKEVSD
jgi:tol-pal system protein YbgF